MPPGSAADCNRAATLTPSPSRSSPSSITSPRLTPMRNLTCRCSGNWSLRVRSAAWISVAHRTASTALPNSARIASPAVLKTRPRCRATSFSKTSLCPRKVRSVCSSSWAIKRLYSATSAERMVASLRSRPSAAVLSISATPTSLLLDTQVDHSTAGGQRSILALPPGWTDRNSAPVSVYYGSAARAGTGGDPMHPDKPIGHAVRHIVAICFAVAILAIGPLTGALAATPKAGKPAASAKSEATPEKIQELMTLLADPKVRDWLEKESKAEAAAQAKDSDAEETSISHEFDAHVDAIRAHIAGLA